MNRAIITGASEGLGYELAKQFLTKGYEVVGLSRRQPELDSDFIKTDLTKEEDINRAVAEIKSKYANFNVLVNCAGMLSVKPVNQIDYKETSTLLNLNVLAPMILTSGLIDLIKKNEADIVNLGSSIAFKSYEEQAAYTASKWAMRGLTTNLQLELKGTKCRVIGFNPGGFKSKIFEKATGVEITDWSAWMDPKDLATLIITLLELPKNMEVSEIIINRK